jgi:translation initiation factor 5
MSTGLINIAGLTPVEDPSYRYKMPRLIGKVEGRGNGIKTVLVNIVELGQSLNREPSEITKFFGCELGAQTTYSEDLDRAIVNGSHTDNDLQNKLRIYIEKFVLCGCCKLPETHYKLKDGLINQKCLACGSKSACDMSHKLTTFIIAQYKKAKAEAKKNEASDKKKDKREKKDRKEVETDGSNKDGSKKNKKKDKKGKK